MATDMRAIALFLATAVTAGCISVRNDNALVPPSALVTDFRAPLVAPRKPIPFTGLKTGRGVKSVFVKEWIWSGVSVDVSDMTLKEAMADGGITDLVYADYEQFSIFGFVTLFTVTAYGE